MAGTIFAADGRAWSTSSWIFYWVVDAMAPRVHDSTLATELREISEYNLGAIDVRDRTQAQRDDLAAVVRQLPAIATAELDETPGKKGVIRQLDELVELLSC